jgi:hypothetical protein
MEQVHTGEAKHAFTYRVRVTNARDKTIQVLGRSWTILDAAGALGERRWGAGGGQRGPAGRGGSWRREGTPRCCRAARRLRASDPAPARPAPLRSNPTPQPATSR